MEDEVQSFVVDGVSMNLSVSSNPFGEHYIILSSDGKMIAGIVMEKKKNAIEFRNKVSQTIRIEKEEKSSPTPSRKLD